jgi:hypothetical protein
MTLCEIRRGFYEFADSGHGAGRNEPSVGALLEWAAHVDASDEHFELPV